MSEQTVYCSFCGKNQHEVATIVTAPPNIAICDECVLTCVEMVFGQNRKKTKQVEEFERQQDEPQLQHYTPGEDK